MRKESKVGVLRLLPDHHAQTVHRAKRGLLLSSIQEIEDTLAVLSGNSLAVANVEHPQRLLVSHQLADYPLRNDGLAQPDLVCDQEASRPRGEGAYSGLDRSFLERAWASYHARTPSPTMIVSQCFRKISN